MNRVVDLLRRDHLDQRRLTVLGRGDASLEGFLQVAGRLDALAVAAEGVGGRNWLGMSAAEIALLAADGVMG